MEGGRDHKYGMNHQDDRRRELRRPMANQGSDLVRDMARFDPFMQSQDYPVMGGMQARPAPSAEGWSSGENHFDYCQTNHLYQQQQQQPANPMAHAALQHQEWNVGASEFVPKSNLSASAAEFVPRSMARNTSQWGYQNQVQGYYQQPQTGNYNSSGGGNPYLDATGGSRSSGGSASAGSSLYNIDEYLSDAIATITFMPTKLDRAVQTLSDKINSCVTESSALSNLASVLVDSCISEENFRPLAGRFTAHLAKNVRLNFNGETMHTMILDRCKALHAAHIDLMAKDEKQVRLMLSFMADLFYHLDANKCEKNESLADNLLDMFNTIFTVAYNDEDNLITATNMLKICGRALENDEIQRSTSSPANDAHIRATPRVDQLMALVQKLANDDQFAPAMRKRLTDLMESRANETWGTTACLPNIPNSEPAPKPRSKAILIEPDPADSARNQQSGLKAPQPNVVSNSEFALSEEEIAFMNEYMPNEPNNLGEAGDGGQTDDENDMPDDVREAYEEFLQEQEKQGT